MDSGRTREAVQIYDDLIKQSRFSRDIHEALFRKGLCLQAMKQYQRAIACWKTLLRRYTNTEWDDDALLEMGNTYAQSLNQPKKALRCYKLLIRDYPRSERLIEARYQLGVAAYMKGDYRKAKASFEAVLSKYPGCGLAREAQEWLSRTSTAQNSLTRSHTRKPKSGMNQPKRKTSGLRRDMATEVAKAEAIQARGKTKEALRAFQRIVKNNVWGRGYDRALFRLGQCYVALGAAERAIETWQKILRLSRMNLTCEYADNSLLTQAETWLNALGKPDKALKCCRTLQTEYPNSDLILQSEHIIGLVYFHQGKLDKARAVFERELARTPQSTDTNALLTGLERLIIACRDPRSAGIFPGTGSKTLTRAETLVRMGNMQFTAKEYAKARRAYKKAVRAAPGTEPAAYALLQTGRCLNQMRKYRQALQRYKQFLTKYRQSEYADDALLRAGVIYVGPLHNMAAGAKLYTLILQRYPKSNEAETAQYHMATLAYWKKDWNQALSLYQQVVKTWPNGRYAEFIAAKRVPELVSLLKKKSKLKRRKS